MGVNGGLVEFRVFVERILNLGDPDSSEKWGLNGLMDPWVFDLGMVRGVAKQEGRYSGVYGAHLDWNKRSLEEMFGWYTGEKVFEKISASRYTRSLNSAVGERFRENIISLLTQVDEVLEEQQNNSTETSSPIMQDKILSQMSGVLPLIAQNTDFEGIYQDIQKFLNANRRKIETEYYGSKEAALERWSKAIKQQFYYLPSRIEYEQGREKIISNIFKK